jgi:hypothetical protein
VCVWCAKKDEAKKSEHEQSPPLHGVPGRDRLSSRERRGTKMSKSVEVEERSEGEEEQSMRKSKESSLREGKWSKAERRRRW